MILLASEFKWIGLEIFNGEDLVKLIIRFAFNLITTGIIIRYIYYPAGKRKDYLFTFFLISTVIFFLCFMLDNVNLEMGLALGLFAIFGIIRYRTNPIPIKEMTYLFVVIGVSVVNALANKRISLAEVVMANTIIIFLVLGFERLWKMKHESSKLIIYENIDLIGPDRREELLADLEKRTGHKITKIDIIRIDYLRDTARIMVYYLEKEQYINMADQPEMYSGDD